MKAHMSDRRARAEYLSAYGPASGLTVHEQREEHMKEALHEARRILAETEPESSSAYHVPAGDYVNDGALGGPHFVILADALRAFVNEG